MPTESRIWTDIEFEEDGSHIGELNLPFSSDRSAYGVIKIPVAVFKNGDGPTMLVMAGVHGDEWEGQIIVSDLIRSMRPEMIRGRLILMPSVNFPACRVGSRTSPIDGVNLNRCFPGNATGTVTEQIAFYIDSVLMPLADIIIDLHSGGRSLDYLLCTFVSLLGDEEFDEKARSALKAFAGDYASIQVGGGRTGFSGTTSDAALRRRKVLISGEFGSGGSVSRDGLEFARSGVLRVARFIGLLDQVEEQGERGIQLLRVDSSLYFCLSPSDGVFEPYVSLGQAIERGQVLGRVLCLDDPLRDPRDVTASAAGIVVALRALGHAERGDCLVHLGEPIGLL